MNGGRARSNGLERAPTEKTMTDAAVPAGAGARAATPGYDPRAHDPFFDGVSDQLADKGFLVARALKILIKI